jgi:thioredoxin reductase (NADPH)
MVGADSTDVVIIGGGVAALSAATFAAQLGLRTMVMTDILMGGQILNVEHIANYPGFPEPVSGADLAALMEQQANDAGAEFVFDVATAITLDGDGFVVSGASGDVSTRSVIVATGSALRKLDVPGESEFDGRGVSYCGSCDAALFKGRPVAVVGGGDSACDEALVVANYASSVTLVVREAALHAAAATCSTVLANDRISVLYHHEPTEIRGDAAVAALILRPLEGAAQPTAQLDVAGVFVYVGLQPNTDLLAGLVELDDDGRVVTDAQMQTSVPGLFAAGDIRAGSGGYLVNAASDGSLAALAAHRRLASLAT